MTSQPQTHPRRRCRTTRPALLAVLLALATSTACGESDEDRLRKQVHQLKANLEDSTQRHEDLKARMQAIRARNKVLIGLVEGLTGEPDTAGLPSAKNDAPLGSASKALEELDRDIDFLATTLQSSRKDFEELRTERQTLRANLAEAMRTIEEAQRKEQRARLRADTARQMLLNLKSMIEAEKLELQIVRNQMVVELPEAVLFETGRSTLKHRGKKLLAKLAKVMQAIKSRNFQIAGHTDSVPIWNKKFLSNWDLSAARAVTVTRFLIKRGVDPDRLSATGYASTKPRVAIHKGMVNKKKAHEQNRRIEIILLPNLEELPDLKPLMNVFEEVAAKRQAAAAADSDPVAAEEPRAAEPAAGEQARSTATEAEDKAPVGPAEAASAPAQAPAVEAPAK